MTGPQERDTGRAVLLVGTGRDHAAIEASLSKAGFTPETLAGPVEALLRAARDPANVAGALVRVDVLPDDDLDVIAALRRTLPNTVLVALHGPGAREKAARALLLGADAALAEPFYWIELVALLGRFERRATQVTAASVSDSERELELVARLAGGVAHEINNPLTIISGWVQVLLTEMPESEPRHRTLAAIRDEAARIARVVRDLQTFARRKAPVLAPVDRNALIRS
ncbi:MAG: hypothetical protein HYR85_01910 [Planctomycetes bacterium]|nr:hypothetical protein [Planctomycetota bacterium]